MNTFPVAPFGLNVRVSQSSSNIREQSSTPELQLNESGFVWDGNNWQVIFSDSLFYIPNSYHRNYTIPDVCFQQDPIKLNVQMDSQIGASILFAEEQIRWETDSLEIVGFEETVQLPQLQSLVEPDDVGLERTYLYCTWIIDGNGEEAIQMSSVLCPDPQEEFTFLNDESYYRRIDRADIFWNTTSTQWEIQADSTVDESLIEYQLDIPEPPQRIFDNIFDTILDLVQNILCQLFPNLGFCDP